MSEDTEMVPSFSFADEQPYRRQENHSYQHCPPSFPFNSPGKSSPCSTGVSTTEIDVPSGERKRSDTNSSDERPREKDNLMEEKKKPELCSCHTRSPDTEKIGSRNKLLVACVAAIAFMTAEVAGGYFANSLAIMTDAAHMLSDFAAFLISLCAIWIGQHKPSKRMSFGWYRAEVVGAVISVLIIWLLTGVLVYNAILRIINQNYDIDADIMLITAAGGVFVNVIMMAVLGHGHHHSHGKGDSHGHTAQERNHRKKSQLRLRNIFKKASCCHSNDIEMKQLVKTEGDAESCNDFPPARRFDNINLRAAFIHVIGDLIQSAGVVIAGYIIKFWPSLKLADPICTFLFSILVLFSTVNVLTDALLVIMEAIPRHIPYDDVLHDLQCISGVRHAHSLHIWSLTTNRAALSAHLAINQITENSEILKRAYAILKEKYGIKQITLQVEEYHSDMDYCHVCRQALSAGAE